MGHRRIHWLPGRFVIRRRPATLLVGRLHSKYPCFGGKRGGQATSAELLLAVIREAINYCNWNNLILCTAILWTYVPVFVAFYNRNIMLLVTVTNVKVSSLPFFRFLPHKNVSIMLFCDFQINGLLGWHWQPCLVVWNICCMLVSGKISDVNCLGESNVVMHWFLRGGRDSYESIAICITIILW